MSIRFEWDPAKNDANQRKHGLRFEDARPIFIWEAERLDQRDGDHWANEERFISIGPIAAGFITVVWAEPADDLVRLISVRQSTKRERERYRRYKSGSYE
jgi:uncharacterized DUF497 family protein